MSLHAYMKTATDALLADTGALVAFSQSQFDAQRQPGVTYVTLSSGLLCPADRADEFITRFDDIHAEAIRQDLAANGIKKIIWRELANYEAQITGDITDTADALSEYPGITPAAILAEFRDYMQHCIDNDYF
jgi:hypothetical protein